jgi:hypothetical protein
VEVDAILLENAFESSPRKRPHRAFSVLSLHRTTIKPKRKKIKIYSGKKLVMHELHESLYYLKVANLERTRLPMSAAGVQVRQCAPAKGIQHYPRSGASWNHCFHLKTQQFFDFLWIRAKRKQLNTWYQTQAAHLLHDSFGAIRSRSTTKKPDEVGHGWQEKIAAPNEAVQMR